MWWSDKTKMVAPEAALAGRETPIEVPGVHAVTDGRWRDHSPTTPSSWSRWAALGAERVFWQREGVWVTSVGFAGHAQPDVRGSLLGRPATTRWWWCTVL